MSHTRIHHKYIALGLLTTGTLAFSLSGCSETPAATNTSSTKAPWSDSSTRNESSLSGTVYDPSTVHSFEVTYDESTYTEMLSTYQATGDKEWLEATVEIDGQTFEKVGLRLKGNSSLRSITTDTMGEDIPWLIRLDEFVTNQNVGGQTEFVVRSNTSETALNEAIAQQLLAEAGLASQAPIAIRFSANGSEESLRLVVENPNDAWEDSQFETDGILYKAEADGDYSYRGDDAASYTDVFDQETNTEAENYTPLMEFLKFINESSDEDFASQLSEHLDVDAFASYLAMQDLVDNFDDIDGPGNNSYLRWDESSDTFTVVNWDLNLAFGSTPGGMGGGFGGGKPGQNTGGEDGATTRERPEMPEGFDPDNMPQPPTGGQAGGQGKNPESTQLQNNAAQQDGETQSQSSESEQGNQAPQGGGHGGGMNRSNILKERFLEVTEFEAKYEQANTDLRELLFESGRAEQILTAWTEMLNTEASDLVSQDVVSSDAAKISSYFDKE